MLTPLNPSPRPGRPFWALGTLVLLCGLGAAAPALAAATTDHAPLLAGWFNSFTGFLEGSLNNRARIVQFALIAMMLALWIIWWRK